MTNRSGTKAYFFKSLRISFSAACLFRLDWIEDLAFRVDGPPKVDHPAVNFQIDLVGANPPLGDEYGLSRT